MNSSKKVLISSILKPVNDVRLFSKIGLSLSQFENLEIHICGFKSSIPTDTNIHFHPLFSFKRTSIKRVLSYLNYTILLVKVKPNIIICNTSELLLVNSIYKILFGAEYYYNLEENYYRNIRYTNNFPFLIRHILAPLVRLKELLCHPFITHYLVAEECYLSEMPFIKNNSTTILNKFKHDGISIKPNKGEPKPHFIYTGTIAEQYGIFEVVYFIKSIQKIYPDTQLHIIGFCPNTNTLSRLKSAIKNLTFIRLTGGENPVDHHQIIQEINNAYFAIIAYKNNPSLNNCFPTKIYEYLHYQVPIISLTSPAWTKHDVLKNNLLTINSNKNFINKNIETIFSTNFNTPLPLKDIYWKTEETKLFRVLGLPINNF